MYNKMPKIHGIEKYNLRIGRGKNYVFKPPS